MNIAEKYFQEQLSVAEFRHSYIEEKVKLDIEYQLEELKRLTTTLFFLSTARKTNSPVRR